MCVARLMRGLSFSTIETVATETFARRATSRMLTLPVAAALPAHRCGRRLRLGGFSSKVSSIACGKSPTLSCSRVW